MTSLWDLIKPSSLTVEPSSVVVNGQLNRVITAVGYPRLIKEGWLSGLIGAEGNFDISLHIEPSSFETVLTGLNRELVKQRSDLMSAEMKGSVNPSLKIQYDDTLRVLQDLQSGKEKLFQLSLYVNARAPNRDQLELVSHKVEGELNGLMIVPKTPTWRMLPAFQSVWPLGKDHLRIQRNIPSNALAACFPFTNQFLNLHEEGILFGLNAQNKVPVIIDPYQLPNYNGLVLGTSGGGKSFLVKLLALRNHLRGVPCMIIDPQGEYVQLAKAMGGEVVDVGPDSDSIINPMDLLNKDLSEKMLSLMDLFKIMGGELNETQQSILDFAVTRAYEYKGIKMSDPSTWKREPPTLHDVYLVMEEQRGIASKMEKMTYESLMNRLRIYAEGSFKFLNKKTNLDLDNSFIVFNIANLPNAVKPVVMYLILDFIYDQMKKSKERRLVIIDEAWTLLRHATHANYVFEMIKTARKFGLGITIITQEVNDLLQSEAGKTILANTAWKLLLRQEPSVVRELTERFNLNQNEQSLVLSSQKGEGLLLALNDHLPIKIIASKHEHELVTSNPDEIRNQSLKMDVVANARPYYLSKELGEKDLEFVKGKGYKEAKMIGIDGKLHNYWVSKPANVNESIEHYLVVELVAEEARQLTNRVITYSTIGPDVLFYDSNNQLVAIEVETGKTMEKNRKSLEEKVKRLNQEYKKWFFVVLEANLKNDYNKLGKSILRTDAKKTIQQAFDSTESFEA